MENRLALIEDEYKKTLPEKVLEKGNALQQTTTAFTTAVTVQKPRQMPIVMKNLLQEAKLAGGAFYYRWPVKTKRGTQIVQGPSVDLAMSMARQYGNCVVDVEVKETHSHYLFKGVFIDLETGFTVPRLFRQRKNQNMGNKMDADRQEDIVFQIGHSKAQRNAIIKAMPGWLVQQLIEVARQAEVNGIAPENLELSRSKAIEVFEGYGITSDQLVEKLGKDPDKWMQDEIVSLREMAKSIKDGQISAKELFPQETKPDTKMESKLKAAVSGQKEPEPQKETPAEEKKEFDANKEPKTDPHPWDRPNWINTRTAGFSTFVMKNKDTWPEVPEAVEKEVREKWAALYPDDPFVLDVLEDKQIDDGAAAKQDGETQERCGVFGTGLADDFFMKANGIDQALKYAQDIWDHPTKYRDNIGADDSSQAYNKFLKHLVVCADGVERPIFELIKKEKPETGRVNEQYVDCPNGEGRK